MSIEELSSMHNAIARFEKRFKKQFGEEVTVLIGTADSPKLNKNRVAIRIIERIALRNLTENYPAFKSIKNFKYRTRKVQYMMHLQAFCIIAYIEGYNKSEIARYIERNHASIINSIDQAENYLYQKWPEYVKIHSNTLIQLNNYVGIPENNIKKQNNTQPSTNTILLTGKNIIAYNISAE